MKYQVKINEFEGPLDLLLHLIKESKVSIYDIKIEEITEQYLDYINAMEEMNLNIASEYLVMAAELIEMKSRMLLPNNKEENNEESLEDMRENLINRLIEYERYKEVTPKLKELEEKRLEIYTKVPSSLIEYSEEKVVSDVSLADLLNAFNEYMNRKKLEKPLVTKVTNKEYSVSEYSNKIKNILKNKKKVTLMEVIEEKSIPIVIVTFLSVLELVKKNEISIIQEDNFAEIYLLEVK